MSANISINNNKSKPNLADLPYYSSKQLVPLFVSTRCLDLLTDIIVKATPIPDTLSEFMISYNWTLLSYEYQLKKRA